MAISEQELKKIREEIKVEILEELKNEKIGDKSDPFEEKLKKYK